jgi:hypothetical protein
MPATVYVKNIAAATGDAEIKDFFSFWFVLPLPKVPTES